MLAGATAIAPTGCGGIFPKKYRFRMTVEVDTPQGLKSGSAVYEVKAYKAVRLTSEERSGGGGLRGQALEVELPDGPIFALLVSNDGGSHLASSATKALSHKAQISNIDDYVAAVGELGAWYRSAEAELPRAEWPMLVRFGNIDDSTSVDKVDPDTIGVKRILLETTGDGVTTGIEERLKWLGDPGLTLDPKSGPTIHPTVAQSLRQTAFWQGHD